MQTDMHGWDVGLLREEELGRGCSRARGREKGTWVSTGLKSGLRLHCKQGIQRRSLTGQVVPQCFRGVQWVVDEIWDRLCERGPCAADHAAHKEVEP